MGRTAVHQPHDKLFKATFSKIPNARAFCEHYLPAQVVPKLNWKTLRRLSTTLIHPGLKGSESDLLFSVCAHGSRGVCYLLLEHQSTEDPYLALRMAGYVHGVLERHRRDHPLGKMPRVLAVILAQCKGPWKSACNPADIFPWEEGPEWTGVLREHALSLRCHLVDLFGLMYEEIRGTPDGVMGLRVLKAAQEADLLNDWV